MADVRLRDAVAAEVIQAVDVEWTDADDGTCQPSVADCGKADLEKSVHELKAQLFNVDGTQFKNSLTTEGVCKAQLATSPDYTSKTNRQAAFTALAACKAELLKLPVYDPNELQPVPELAATVTAANLAAEKAKIQGWWDRNKAKPSVAGLKAFVEGILAETDPVKFTAGIGTLRDKVSQIISDAKTAPKPSASTKPPAGDTPKTGGGGTPAVKPTVSVGSENTTLGLGVGVSRDGKPGGQPLLWESEDGLNSVGGNLGINLNAVRPNDTATGFSDVAPASSGDGKVSNTIDANAEIWYSRKRAVGLLTVGPPRDHSVDLGFKTEFRENGVAFTPYVKGTAWLTRQLSLFGTVEYSPGRAFYTPDEEEGRWKATHGVRIEGGSSLALRTLITWGDDWKRKVKDMATIGATFGFNGNEESGAVSYDLALTGKFPFGETGKIEGSVKFVDGLLDEIRGGFVPDWSVVAKLTADWKYWLGGVGMIFSHSENSGMAGTSSSYDVDLGSEQNSITAFIRLKLMATMDLGATILRRELNSGGSDQTGLLYLNVSL